MRWTRRLGIVSAGSVLALAMAAGAGAGTALAAPPGHAGPASRGGAHGGNCGPTGAGGRGASTTTLGRKRRTALDAPASGPARAARSAAVNTSNAINGRAEKSRVLGRGLPTMDSGRENNRDTVI